jgi:hypothetical protein
MVAVAGCSGDNGGGGSEGNGNNGNEPDESSEATTQKDIQTTPEDSTRTPTSSETEIPTETEPRREFDGWVNESELADGYTVVHISSEWEIVPAEETDEWDPDTVEIFRRGFCKRYFVYKNVPEGYNLLTQGRCSEGVRLSIQDEDGRVIAQIKLPEKDVER